MIDTVVLPGAYSRPRMDRGHELPVSGEAAGKPGRSRARKACAECFRVKKGCDGKRPCVRCVKVGVDCKDNINNERKRKERGQKRSELSCMACRAAKAACTDVRPCLRCVKRGTQCVDAPPRRRKQTHQCPPNVPNAVPLGIPKNDLQHFIPMHIPPNSGFVHQPLFDIDMMLSAGLPSHRGRPQEPRQRYTDAHRAWMVTPIQIQDFSLFYNVLFKESQRLPKHLLVDAFCGPDETRYSAMLVYLTHLVDNNTIDKYIRSVSQMLSPDLNTPQRMMLNRRLKELHTVVPNLFQKRVLRLYPSITGSAKDAKVLDLMDPSKYTVLARNEQFGDPAILVIDLRTSVPKMFVNTQAERLWRTSEPELNQMRMQMLESALFCNQPFWVGFAYKLYDQAMWPRLFTLGVQCFLGSPSLSINCDIVRLDGTRCSCTVAPCALSDSGMVQMIAMAHAPVHQNTSRQ